MGYREEWKMIHVLNMSKNAKLTAQELAEMGVDCRGDTIMPLIYSRIVEFNNNDGTYELSQAANMLVNKFIVCNGDREKTDLHVDQPSCFVIMPFSEVWSEDVYRKLIEPALSEVGLECIRGDEIERTGQLNSNIFKTIQWVGFVIAEISSPNPNVYYEIGVADTLGKEILFLYDPNKNNKIPADKVDVHYLEYAQSDLYKAKENLKNELQKIISRYKLFATPKYCKTY
jgi:hypothetical protein